MKKKINIRFMIIAAVAILVTAASAMWIYYNILKDQVFADLKAYAHIIARMDFEEWTGDLEADPYDLWEDELRVTLVDAGGTVLYDSRADKDSMENHRLRPEIEEALRDGEATAIRYSSTLSLHTFYYAQRLEDGRVLRIGKNSESITSIMVNTMAIVLIMAILVFGVSALVSHLLTRRLMEPVEQMAENIMRVDEAQVYEEMRPFVAMIKEQHVDIIKSARMRQEFTANVSHELKTPLTAISGYAELIGSGMTQGEDTKRFAGEIHHNANRLLSLINDIIKLTELGESEHRLEMEPVELYGLACKCAGTMAVTAKEQAVALHVEGEETWVTANSGLMEELLYNLCSNGIRYNRRGGSVTITVGSREGRAFLRVEDTGIGIPEESRERVFERFYRVDKSRSKSTGGTGLGLAIVKHIVAQHNAHITLESELGQGTTIEVTF